MSTNPFPSTGPRLGNVRVVSLNLWGRNGAWADRRSVLIDGFRALRPDLVALQEVIKNDEYDQMIDLLGPGFHIAHQKGRDPEGMGISIASRWRSEEHTSELQSRQYLVCRLLLENKKSS